MRGIPTTYINSYGAVGLGEGSVVGDGEVSAVGVCEDSGVGDGPVVGDDGGAYCPGTTIGGLVLVGGVTTACG